MSQYGKPGAQSPQAVAKQVGLKVKGGELSWADLADAAFQAYWNSRSTDLPFPRTPWWNAPNRRPRDVAA